MNAVALIGRLTKDIEVKYTQSGLPVASFQLAVNRAYKKEDGEQETDYISCVAWRQRAENLAKMTTKGSQIGITGNIQTRTYENKQGQTVYVTEVMVDNFYLIETKEMTNQRRAQNKQSNQQGGYGGYNQPNQGGQNQQYQQPQNNNYTTSQPNNYQTNWQ